jgi:hypothetical protein
MLPAPLERAYPLLSLEEWREQIGWNPWHFWGWAGAKVPITSACNTVVKEWSWQATDASGRRDIANAIMQAEERIFPYLGYRPAPRYTQETLAFPLFPQVDTYRLGYSGSDARWVTERVSERNLIAVGVEKKTLLGAAQVVAYTDTDGDGLNDTFTATCNTTLTNPDIICAYFQTTDRLYADDAWERWRIRPVKVSISGGVATITGRAWLMAKPILNEGVSPNALDPSIAANFVSAIDVYSRVTNPDGLTFDDAQATLIWETPPYPQWAVSYGPPPASPGGFDPAAQAYAIARAVVRDARNGEIGFGESVYSAVTGLWSAIPWYYATSGFLKPPDRVVVRYLAGADLDKESRMKHRMASIVARVAAAELNRRICGCQDANRQLQAWQFDLARSAGAGDEAYAYISREDLSNPLGTRRGHVSAWHDLKADRVLTGFSI